MSDGHGPTGELLTRAASHGRVDLEPLVAAVPGMIHEAARRRRLAATPSARIFDVASFWMPRLAAATLAIALTAVVLSRFAPQGAARSGGDESTALDGWILTGSSQSRVQDPVLDALVR